MTVLPTSPLSELLHSPFVAGGAYTIGSQPSPTDGKPQAQPAQPSAGEDAGGEPPQNERSD